MRNGRDTVITESYTYVHILKCLKALDWRASDVDVGVGATGEPYVRHARRVVLTASIPEGVNIFRLAESIDLLLVSQRFRDEWQRRGLTGADFEALGP